MIDGDGIWLLQPLSGYIQELASRRKRVMKFFVNISSFHAAGCHVSDEVFEPPATRITFLTPYLGRDARYGFGNSRIDHSGEFNHSYIEMGNYWDEVMKQAGLK